MSSAAAVGNEGTVDVGYPVQGRSTLIHKYYYHSSFTMDKMLTSAASASSSASAAFSAASSTSVIVTGIAVGSALIAVIFLLTLLGREVVDSSENQNLSTQAFNVALVPLAMAFSINVVVQVFVYLNYL